MAFHGWKKCQNCGDPAMDPATGSHHWFHGKTPDEKWANHEGCVRRCQKCGHVEAVDELDAEWIKHWFHGDTTRGGFEICGCFDPASGLDFLKVLLRDVKDNSILGMKDFPDGAKQLLWGMLEAHGLTSHGGCLPGWLTKAGETILAYLEALPAGADPLHEETLDETED